jgi:GT2 family glycosyltransferase
MQTKSLKESVNVIMPVWAIDEDTVKLTELAVESLRSAPIKLIIIDNGSTIGGGLMRHWADVYIRNKENLGYARAVNQGLMLCRNKTVAIANNDIRVSPNWWEVAQEALELYNVRSVHFRMIPYEQFFNPGNETWATGKERWCSSSFFVVRTKQLYDEHFLNSLDDLDFWRRFRDEGRKTAYTNRAEYQHLDSWTQQKIGTRGENDAENLAYYIQKWGEHPDAWLERKYPEQMKLPWKPFP